MPCKTYFIKSSPGSPCAFTSFRETPRRKRTTKGSWVRFGLQQRPNAEIKYESSGAGGGIRQLSIETVFVGASDGPMTNDQLAGAPGAILHFPTVLGGVAPSYNIPGVTASLKFTGAVLAEIYLGKITKWNDPAIVKLNRGVALPSLDIAAVHRSDGSGTNYIFCDYLSKVYPEFKK